MNIVDFTKRFHEMEMTNKLFELKTFDDIYFWDIVRYDVFYFIFSECLNSQPKQNIVLKKNRGKLSFSRTTRALKKLLQDYKYLYANRKKKYVFFKCSRNFIDGKDTDVISDDYLSIIGDDCFIIETFGNSMESNNFRNSLLGYKKKSNRLFKKKAKEFGVDKIINITFGLEVHLDDIITKAVDNFKLERKHYRKLLKKLKPNAVFFVQNGIQKALMYMCKELEIQNIELQHGIINYCHQAYSYPNEIKKYKQNEVIAPDVFFCFSDFWIKNINYPVKALYAIGNTHYGAPISSVNQIKDEITFISADIYQKKIESYLDYLLEVKPKAKINLKLHPNQMHERNEICNKYSNYKNVNIYCTEVTVNELFNRSDEVIILTSTAAYEAIQSGCRLGIIKDTASYNIMDLFNHPNTRILEKPEEILYKYNNEPVSSVYFDMFNDDMFERFIILLERNIANRK